MSVKAQLIYLLICFITIPLALVYGLAWPLKKTKKVNCFLVKAIAEISKLIWTKVKQFGNSQFLDNHWCTIIVTQISVEIIVLFLIIYPT